MPSCIRCGFTADVTWYVDGVISADTRKRLANRPPDVVICTDCMEEIV